MSTQTEPRNDNDEPSPRSSRAQDYVNSYKPEDVPTPAPTFRGPFIHTEDASPSGSSSTSSSPSASATQPAMQAPNNPPDLSQPHTNVAAVDVQIDVEAAEKWSRERDERKMQGEYERAGRALSEMVYDNLDMPLKLNAIRIQGTKSTRPGFLSSLVAPYLSERAAQGQTLRSVLNTTRELDTVLSSFDIFRQVEAGIIPSPSVLSGPEDVDIVFRVKEAPRYFLRTATDVGNGEGSATATARLRNAFGGGETLEGNVSFGTRTKNAFQVRFETPVNASPTTRFDLTAFSAHRDLSWFASCQERSKGVLARLKGASIYGIHEIAYEAALREIGEVSPAASMSIRNSAGPSVKSSISACFWRDTRDDPFIATRGQFTKLKAEYAGFGGDSHFAKAESEHSISREIGNGWIARLSTRAGLLYPLGKTKSLFVDRFHLGGPTSVRMFRQNGMGPKDNADHIGGDAYWAAGASLFTPIPRKEHWPLKTHLFLNAGRLTGFKDGLANTIESLARQPSVTAGVGLMYRHSIVRVEANLGVPLAMHKHEGAMKGLQFGLGLSFL